MCEDLDSHAFCWEWAHSARGSLYPQLRPPRLGLPHACRALRCSRTTATERKTVSFKLARQHHHSPPNSSAAAVVKADASRGAAEAATAPLTLNPKPAQVAGHPVFVEWPRGAEQAQWKAGPEAQLFLLATPEDRHETMRRLVARIPLVSIRIPLVSLPSIHRISRTKCLVVHAAAQQCDAVVCELPLYGKHIIAHSGAAYWWLYLFKPNPRGVPAAAQAVQFSRSCAAHARGSAALQLPLARQRGRTS